MVKISNSVKVRTNQNDTILIFDPDRDFFHEFNGTASEMFLLLKEGKTSEEIVTALVSKYEVDTLIVEKELKSFINKLDKLGVLEK